MQHAGIGSAALKRLLRAGEPIVSLHRLIEDSFQGVAMGMMDGLITLLGILMGVGAATENPQIVIISGLVGGIANSFGTSVGFYTSEQAERGQQIEFYKKKGRASTKAGDRYVHTPMEIYMETAFSFLAGAAALIFPILPFFLDIPIFESMAASFVISIAMLYMLGYKIGQLNREHAFKSGFKYMIIGVVSALVALLVGELLKGLILGNSIV